MCWKKPKGGWGDRIYLVSYGCQDTRTQQGQSQAEVSSADVGFTPISRRSLVDHPLIKRELTTDDSNVVNKTGKMLVVAGVTIANFLTPYIYNVCISNRHFSFTCTLKLL